MSELYKCGLPKCSKVESVEKEFMLCANCKYTRYCSRSCQVEDWKNHKQFCKLNANKVCTLNEYLDTVVSTEFLGIKFEDMSIRMKLCKHANTIYSCVANSKDRQFIAIKIDPNRRIFQYECGPDTYNLMLTNGTAEQQNDMRNMKNKLLICIYDTISHTYEICALPKVTEFDKCETPMEFTY